MSRLFVAEKPSVAKAIASELGVTGRGDGFIECGGDKVSWCFGHMLAQAEPDEYTPDDVPKNERGRKIWRIDELPIIPDEWILRPKEEAEKQISVIGGLVKAATLVVNAGDPDREGQLLVDELLEYLNNRAPVVRYWSSAIDSVSVRRALSDMKDNAEFRGFAKAAEGRGKADWLIGMNLSRAYTLRARRGGSRALLTVGRVQTPTLALVVARDRVIEDFKPVPFHTIHANVEHRNGTFRAVWKPKEDQHGVDADGRLVDTSVANTLIESLRNQPGSISGYKQESKKQNHPLAFSLSGMTALASKRFGYSAEDVLKTCQSLYETHKLTTYPRSDCAYLPESQFIDAAETLSSIKCVDPSLAELVDNADTSIKSRTWNDKKVSAHHGIIPTMHKGDLGKLNEQERNIYSLVVRAYLAQFYPLHEFMSTNVTVDVRGEVFIASGKVITKSGWKDVYLDDAGEQEESNHEDKIQNLPNMVEGDEITCGSVIKNDAKTKPPPSFTEGTLITAMVNVHRFVNDPRHKKILREGDGIGTEATRASIISELKRRNYLETSGKKIISTKLGRSMIDALPDVVKSPVLTALYERMLQSIENGEADLCSFVEKQESFIRDQVEKANAGAVEIDGGQECSAKVSDAFKCMSCGAGLIRRPLPKKKGAYWWGCSSFPSCKQTYPDIKGRPRYEKGRNCNNKE